MAITLTPAERIIALNALSIELDRQGGPKILDFVLSLCLGEINGAMIVKTALSSYLSSLQKSHDAFDKAKSDQLAALDATIAVSQSALDKASAPSVVKTV